MRKFVSNYDEWSRIIKPDLSSFTEQSLTKLNDPWIFMRNMFLLHDQEPLLYESQKEIWDKFIFTRTVFDDRVLILHSEENSRELDKFCKDYNAIPVHWFSNGALAYEWYGLEKFLLFEGDSEKYLPMKYKFSCLNRLIGQQRIYRPILSAMLESTIDHRELQLNCNVIDPDSNKHAIDCLGNLDVPSHHKELLESLGGRVNPIQINISDRDRKKPSSLRFASSDKGGDYFLLTFCHIATETMFYDDTLHLTEKSLRAFVNRRPMILVGPAGSLAYLRRYGFKTFGDFWDEGYDEERDPHKRLDMIFWLIRELNKMSLAEMTTMLRKMDHVLDHNRKHFLNDFPNIVMQELRTNLDEAIVKYRMRDPNGWMLKRIASLNKKEFAEIKNVSVIPNDIMPYQVYEDLLGGDRSSQDNNVTRFLHHYLGLTDVNSPAEALNKIRQILN